MEQTTLFGSFPKRNPIVNFIDKKSWIALDIISALFIFLFLYTAFKKSLDILPTVRVLNKTPFLDKISLPIAWAIVVMECLTAILLFIRKTKKIGFYFSLLLMSAFTIYIIFMKALVVKLPCSCGGIISSLTWTQHLFLNILLVGLAIIGLLLSSKKTPKL